MRPLVRVLWHGQGDRIGLEYESIKCPAEPLILLQHNTISFWNRAITLLAVTDTALLEHRFAAEKPSTQPDNRNFEGDSAAAPRY